MCIKRVDGNAAIDVEFIDFLQLFFLRVII